LISKQQLEARSRLGSCCRSSAKSKRLEDSNSASRWCRRKARQRYPVADDADGSFFPPQGAVPVVIG